MPQTEPHSAMNGRAKQNNQKSPRTSSFCGCIPLFFRRPPGRPLTTRPPTSPLPSPPPSISEAAVHRLSLSPSQSPRATSLLSGVRTRSVRKSSVTAPSEADPEPAHGVAAMYRGAVGGEVKVPKSAYWGKHESWRKQISGQDEPVQGRFRRAYPEYDDDP